MNPTILSLRLWRRPWNSSLNGIASAGPPGRAANDGGVCVKSVIRPARNIRPSADRITSASIPASPARECIQGDFDWNRQAIIADRVFAAQSSSPSAANRPRWAAVTATRAPVNAFTLWKPDALASDRRLCGRHCGVCIQARSARELSGRGSCRSLTDCPNSSMFPRRRAVPARSQQRERIARPPLD